MHRWCHGDGQGVGVGWVRAVRVRGDLTAAGGEPPAAGLRLGEQRGGGRQADGGQSFAGAPCRPGDGVGCEFVAVVVRCRRWWVVGAFEDEPVGRRSANGPGAEVVAEDVLDVGPAAVGGAVHRVQDLARCGGQGPAGLCELAPEVDQPTPWVRRGVVPVRWPLPRPPGPEWRPRSSRSGSCVWCFAACCARCVDGSRFEQLRPITASLSAGVDRCGVEVASVDIVGPGRCCGQTGGLHDVIQRAHLECLVLGQALK